MPVLIRTTIEHDGLVSRRAHRRAMKATMFDIGTHWQDKMIESHFTPQATFKYRHQRRTKRYRERKAFHATRGPGYPIGKGRRIKPKKSGLVDNVLSGALEESMTRHHIVRAFPTRATITIPAPEYIAGSRDARKSNYPNIPKELTTVTAAERRKLDAHAEQRYERHIQRESRRTKTRVRT